MKTLLTIPLASLAMTTFALAAEAAESHFRSWPASAEPLTVGKSVTGRFLATPHPNFGNPKPPSHITYPEVCAWYGALTFAQAAKQEELTRALVARFEPLFGPEAALIPKPDHVDNNVFGGLASEIFLQTRDQRAFDIGKRFADVQWEPAESLAAKFGETTRKRMEQGLSWQTRSGLMTCI